MPARGAIIGFGHIAANGHVPAYLANPAIRIEAVCDNHPERKAVNDILLKGARFYSSADELLATEDLDFVDVSTPPAAHAPFVLKALASGRHVLCEKPLILDLRDLVSISRMMKESGKTVVTVHNWRYSPILLEVGNLLKQDIIGEVRSIEYRVIRTRPSAAVGEGASENWRLDPSMAGGGILVDHGWHAFYLVNEWACGNPKRLECRLEKRKFTDIQVEDTAEVLLEYEKLMARLFFTWAGAERNNTISITGKEGRIHVMDDAILVENDRGSRQIVFPEGLSAGSHHPDWYGEVVQEFLHEMNDPGTAGNNFQEAACCFNLLDHCRQSSISGSPVEIRDWRHAE